MATHYYMAVVMPGKDGNFDIVFPDFPGCVTAGDDIEEAQANAIEALCLHVEGMLEDGEALPEPSVVNAPLPDWLADVDLASAIRMLVPVEVEHVAVRVNISMEGGLLDRLDRVANVRGMSRSGALAAAAKQWMRAG